MSTPAKNIDTFTTFPITHGALYRISPPPTVYLGDVAMPGGAVVSSRTVDIRPASGNASREKQFKLCRPWSHLKVDWQAYAPGLQEATFHIGGEVNQWFPQSAGFWGATGVSYPPLPHLPSNNMVNAAMVKALNKLKEQDIHLGNFIGEFDKTVETVASRATKIANQVLAFQKKFPKEWRKVKAVQTGNLSRDMWCLIPNSWLELQYGWKPLLQDIEGGVRHLYKTARRELPIITVHGSQVSLEPVYINVDTPAFGFESEVHFEEKQEAKCQLAYKVTNATLHELSSLGLLNPAEVIWELTKYSFVADWILPIGPWLSALTGDAGLTFITGSVTKFSRISFKGSRVTVSETSGGDYKLITKSPPVWEGGGFIIDRSCLSSTPFPGLYVKNPMSALHAANAIALLVQAFRR